MPTGTQSYYRPPTPNMTPGGRSINPETGRIADLPGGLDYLAGFGPAPMGVNLPNMAPIIHGGGLASLGQTHQQAFMQALQRFKPSANRTPTPWTPINPYASPTANVNAAHAIQAAAPQTNWWQNPGVFTPPQAPAAVPVPNPTQSVPTIQWAADAPYHPSWGVPGLTFGGRY